MKSVPFKILIFLSFLAIKNMYSVNFPIQYSMRKVSQEITDIHDLSYTWNAHTCTHSHVHTHIYTQC